MITFQFAYTDLDAWIEKQQTETKFKTVKALDKATAIEWFEENVQGDWDSIEQLEDGIMNKQELIQDLIQSADPDTFNVESLVSMTVEELEELRKELYGNES